MTWQPRRQHEGGYLMIDHRASPGLPAGVARMSGFDVKQTSEGKLYEAQTLTCAHCKCVVAKNPYRTRAREYCPKCDHYVCDWCWQMMQHADYIHTPYERLADEMSKGRVITLMGSPPGLLKG